MKKIYKIEFDEPVKVEVVSDEGIMFTDGTGIFDYHEQDCCEKVYADWEQLRDTGFEEEEFKVIEIEGKKGFGLSINGTYGVPCYNRQNGYYSSKLKLRIVRKEVDISDFVKDEEDYY